MSKPIKFNPLVGAASISPSNDPSPGTTVLQLCGFNPIKVFDEQTISTQKCRERWTGQEVLYFITEDNICLNKDNDPDGLNVCIIIIYSLL